MAALPVVYGPRGMIMLSQAFMCSLFGIAYIGILDVPPLPGVALVTGIMPLPLWGVSWFLCSFTLTSAAFKVDQSRALGGLTALLCIWAISYLHYFLVTPVLPSGNMNLAYLSSGMLASMMVNCIGSARLLNHGPSHVEAIEKPGALDAE